MAEEVHNPQRITTRLSEPPPERSSSSGLTARRRLPSQAEQERRREWGNKWGPMVRDAVAKAIGETE